MMLSYILEETKLICDPLRSFVTQLGLVWELLAPLYLLLEMLSAIIVYFLSHIANKLNITATGSESYYCGSY